MSTRVVDQVDDWASDSFSGGYRELHNLADREFSGVVRAGGAELYMTRGVVVGVRMGDIEDFEGASGTVYEAPADALPLLAIMQERGEEVRAKYYSEKTSISKVDKTLSDGGFTGYIELSENVLSGDYYLAYQAGKSMSVAFVGESGKLLEGDEAFETADDEVGIFKVRQVDIDPVEIPEPETPAAGPAGESEPEPTDGAAADGAEQEAVDGDEPADSAEQEAVDEDEPADEPTDSGQRAVQRTDQSAGTAETQSQTPDQSSATTADQGPASDSADQSARADADQPSGATTDQPSSATTDQPSSATTDQSKGTTTETERSTEATAGQSPAPDSTEGAAGRPPSATGERKAGQPAPGSAAGGSRTEQPGGSQPGQGPAGPESRRPADRSRSRQTTTKRGRPGGNAADLETKSIPSIDPANTTVPDETDTPTHSGVVDGPEPGEPETHTAGRGEPDGRERNPQPAAGDRNGRAPTSETQAPASETQAPANETQSAVDDGRLDELESELETKDERIDELESELETATEEREDVERQLEEVRAERDELAEDVERLETELERLEEEFGAAANADRRLTADEALAGTDIFVRYRSKGKATLKKAHGASTRKEEVNENLRLETHTQFDGDTVSVGGQAYDEFLAGTLEFQFVRWVVRELLFEIRDTGHEKALGNLYDVLPRIDRAELAGVIEVTYTEDGQETKSEESFDVVLRDRMGHPLLAANLNDTREATTQAMMERLITSAERVGQANEDFSAAFLVTESFFDPGALEVTSQATQGGLLSRDKRKSFVNLSRKRGYHLCLVEARSENFHLAVPEL